MAEPSNQPWPDRPSWLFAAVTILIMAIAVLLVWVSNYLEVRRIRQSQPHSTVVDSLPLGGQSQSK
jgi:hypothetical protein